MTGQLIAPTGSRQAPYTERGIRRMACWRCGRRAWFQWWHRSCAESLARDLGSNGHYRPLCVPCDIEQNRLVLTFYADPAAEQMVAAYVLEAWADAHESGYCAEFPGECPHDREVLDG